MKTKCWIKKTVRTERTETTATIKAKTVELDELYWFLDYKSCTKTRENIYIMTMVSREPRQITGHVVSRDKNSRMIQKMINADPDAERYCTDRCSGYRDVVSLEKHVFNIQNKHDNFTVEGANTILLWHAAADVFRESWKTFRLS